MCTYSRNCTWLLINDSVTSWMLLQFLRTVYISSSACQSRELAASPLPIFFPIAESPSGTPIRGPKKPIYTPRHRPGARGTPSKEQDGGRGGRHEGFSIRAANRETSGPRTKARASPPQASIVPHTRPSAPEPISAPDLRRRGKNKAADITMAELRISWACRRAAQPTQQ